jgi:anti-sigma factor RsiW
MMTCRQLVEFLIDFVSDELPDDHRRLIEQHLEICPPCVTYIETYRLTIQLTRQLPPRPIPPELADHLRSVLSEICTRPRLDEGPSRGNG